MHLHETIGGSASYKQTKKNKGEMKVCEKNKKPLEPAELTDGQLEDVAGGADGDTKMHRCSKCNQIALTLRLIMGV